MTIAWNGLGANNNWSDGDNWVGGTAPTTADQVAFAGTTRLNPVCDLTSDIFYGVFFSVGAGSFSLGNDINLQGGVYNASSSNQTVGVIAGTTWGGAGCSGTGNLLINTVDSGSGGAPEVSSSSTGYVEINSISGSSTLALTGGLFRAANINAPVNVTNGAELQLFNAGYLSGDVSLVASKLSTVGGAAISGDITADASSTIKPGGIVSSVDVATLDGTAYLVDLDGVGPTADKIAANDIVLSNSPTLTVSTLTNSSDGKVYTILSAITSLTGTFLGLADNGIIHIGGRHLRINYTATTVTLTDVGTLVSWVGGGGDDKLSNSANWDNGAAPEAGDTIHFTGTGYTTLDNDLTADISLTGMEFHAGCGAFTMTGNRITLAGSIINGSANAQTLNIALIMAATRTIDVTGGSVALGGILSGAGGLTKTGGGLLTLSASNTYTGATAIQNGTISANTILSVAAGASALGNPADAAAGTIALGSTTTTGVLVYTGGVQTTDRVINLAGTTGGGTITQSGTGLLKFTSAFTATGVGAKALTLQGSSAGTGEVNAAIVNGAGTTALTKAGSDTWTLSGVNTYTGATTVTGGTLKAGVATQAFGVNSAVSLANTAGVVLDTTGFANAIGSLATGGATGGNVTLGAATLTVGGNGTSTSYDGVIDGTGGLTKIGAGVLTLSGVNTYTGATTVSVGTLSVTGSTHASSAVAVASAAILRGTGDIGGTVTTASGGSISPGTGGTTIGVLTVGNAVIPSGASLSLDLSGTVPTYDKLSSAGTVTLGGALVVASVANPALGKVYVIAEAGVLSGVFTGLVQGAITYQSGRYLEVSYTSTTATLTDVNTPQLGGRGQTLGLGLGLGLDT